jgi:hypothetical protein
MTMISKSLNKPFYYSRLAATAAFVLVAAGAFAQTPAPAPAPAPAPQSGGAAGHDMKGMGGMGGMMDHGAGGGMGMMEHGGGGGMMGRMFCGISEHIDGRLAYLKAELKLTDQQQSAWNGFADSYRAAMLKIAKNCAETETAAGADHSAHHGVVGHLTMMERHMADHLEAVRALKASIEPLYAALNEDQKKTADHVFHHVMGLGMGKMMGAGAGGMEHGGMDHGAGGAGH